MPLKRKTKKGGKEAFVKPAWHTFVPPRHLPPPPPPPILSPQQQATADFMEAKDKVARHDYYVYHQHSDQTFPTRRPAKAGDKYIGERYLDAGGKNSQRKLAAKYDQSQAPQSGVASFVALGALERGAYKLRDLRQAHGRLIHAERHTADNLKTAKKENSFRLYRDSPTQAWKSLGNYDFRDRDSGLHGWLNPHPLGPNGEKIERVFSRGGKRKYKTKKKRTKKHKRRKTRTRKTRTRKTRTRKTHRR
jgi:hypothetical protein